MSLDLYLIPRDFISRTTVAGSLPVMEMAYIPLEQRLMRCHFATQLSSGLISAMKPSKFEDVQSYTWSRFCFMRKNSSQLSQPSVSNISKVLTREHTRQARRFLRSLGMFSMAGVLLLITPVSPLPQSSSLLHTVLQRQDALLRRRQGQYPGGVRVLVWVSKTDPRLQMRSLQKVCHHGRS